MPFIHLPAVVVKMDKNDFAKCVYCILDTMDELAQSAEQGEISHPSPAVRM